MCLYDSLTKLAKRDNGETLKLGTWTQENASPARRCMGKISIKINDDNMNQQYVPSVPYDTFRKLDPFSRHGCPSQNAYDYGLENQVGQPKVYISLATSKIQ